MDGLPLRHATLHGLENEDDIEPLYSPQNRISHENRMNLLNNMTEKYQNGDLSASRQAVDKPLSTRQPLDKPVTPLATGLDRPQKQLGSETKLITGVPQVDASNLIPGNLNIRSYCLIIQRCKGKTK